MTALLAPVTAAVSAAPTLCGCSSVMGSGGAAHLLPQNAASIQLVAPPPFKLYAPEQQPCESGLATACGSYKCNRAASRRRERHLQQAGTVPVTA